MTTRMTITTNRKRMTMKQANKSYIIGISGPSGSGKSTLAAYLAEHLPGAVTVCSDHFFKKELPKIVSPLDGAEYPDWNHPTSVDFTAMAEKLDALSSDPDIRYIIAEGAYIYCIPEIRERCDYKLYVTATIGMRLYRRICRNIVKMGQTAEFIGGYYLACARYREAEYSVPSARYADLIIDNEHDFTPAKEEILGKLQIN